MKKYVDQLDDNIYFLGAKHCSQNILNIILDFPDSLGVILSLKRCLDKAPLVKHKLLSWHKLNNI